VAVDLIVRGIDKVVGDGTLTDDQAMAASLRRGAIAAHVTAGAEVPSRHLSGKQVPPAWVVVRSDITEAQVEQYLQPWYPEISFSRQSLDASADSWRGTVTAQLVRTGDGHGLTRAQAEALLLKWNISNMAFSQGEVSGDFSVFDLATSERFLGRDLSGLTFESRNYVEATGEHHIRMDYGSVFPSQDALVLAWMEQRVEILRQNAGRNDIDYSVWRGTPTHDPSPREPLPGDDMFAEIKEDIEEALNRKIATRRWVFSSAAVDSVISAGGFAEVSPAQLFANLEDTTEL